MGSFLSGATSLCGLLLYLTLAYTQDIPTAGGENDRCFIHVSGGEEVCFYDPNYPGFECTNQTNKYPSYPSCRLWGACYTPMAEESEVCYYLHGYGYQCYFKYDEKIIANMTNCNDLKANSPPEIRINYGGNPTIVVDEDVVTLADWITISDADAQQSEIDGDGYIRISMAVTNGYIGFEPDLVVAPAEKAAAEVALDPNTALGGRANFEGGKNGSLTDSLAFTIRTAALNAIMKSFAFVTTPHFNEAQGTSILTVDVDDQGNTGGTPETTSETVTIKANQVNDAPVVTMAASYTTNEDVSLLLSGISVSDVDATESGALHNGVIRTTATIIGDGTISYAGGIGGCGVSPCVDDTNPKELILNGQLAEINAILATITFVPTADIAGTTNRIQIVANDRTQTGSGPPGGQETTVSRLIVVTPINDKPVITHPASYTADEDTPLLGLVPTTVSDVDHTTGLNLTLEVSNGLLSHAGHPTGPLLHLGDASVTDINNFFTTLTYLSNENFNGMDSVVITVSDGVDSETKTVPIEVVAVNDPPVLEARCSPGVPCTSAQMNLSMADTTFALTDGAAAPTTPFLHFTDLDAGAAEKVLLVISVDEGLLTLPPGSFGATTFTLPDVTTGTDPGPRDTFYLLAPKSDVNSMLAGLQYTNPGGVWPDSLDVMISDLGLTGKGDIGNAAIVINFSV